MNSTLAPSEGGHARVGDIDDPSSNRGYRVGAAFS